MRMRIATFMATGVLLTAFASAGTYIYMRQLESELATAKATLHDLGEMAETMVAGRDIAAGAPVLAQDFVIRRMPRSMIPANAIPDRPTATQADAASYFAATDIRMGSLITESMFGAGGKDPSAIRPDAAAIFLSPENFSEYRQQLTPGALVNLFWTRPVGGGGTETRLLASGLRVLGVTDGAPESEGRPAGAPAAKGRIIVEARNQDAAAFIGASNRGQIDITLSGGALPAGEREIVVGAGDLRDLPLAYREGTNAGPLAMLPAFATGEDRARPVCRVSIVKNAARIPIEVPC